MVVRDRQTRLDHCVDQPTSLVIDIDDQLTDQRATVESEDPNISVKARVDDLARDKTSVHRPHIANRRPDAGGVRLDNDFFADGCYLSVSCLPVEQLNGSRLAASR